MSTITVSDRSELLSALGSARASDTIVLEAGSYGSLDIVGVAFSDYVTIRSETPLAARFTDISVEASSHVRIDGVHVDNPGNGATATKLVLVDNSAHVQFVNSEVNGRVDDDYLGFYALNTRDSTDVTFANNYIHDVLKGGVFYTTEGLNIVGNQADYIGTDMFQFVGNHGLLIENNIGPRYAYPFEGAHADFMQFTGSDSSDITIRGNVLLPENWDNLQGIFLDDAHYTDVLIEQSIIVTGMIRGISVSSGTNVVARDNTVLDVEGAGSKATKVAVDGTSYGNLMESYWQEAGPDGSNFILQQEDSARPHYAGDVFQNLTDGRGLTLEDLRPVAGGPAETYGAHDRLMELTAARDVGHLYEAGLGRAADAAGLDFWTGVLLEGDLTEEDIAAHFLASPEFAARVGAPADTLSDEEFVELVYLNALDREGDAAGLDFWTDALAAPGFDRADLLVAFAESPENRLAAPEIPGIGPVTDGFLDFL
jgi:hypothetical protein